IVQSLPHSLVLVDRKLRIVFANRAAASLLGVPGDRMRGRSIAALIGEANLGSVLPSSTTKVFETAITARGRAGVSRMVKIPSTPLKGAASLALLVLENISEQVLLEELLVETQKQAAMGQLAAGILHEIANPLTSLGSNLLFLRGALTRAKDAEVLQALDVSV